MPRRGPRKRIARGIYDDASGRSGIYYVHGKPKEVRFPPFTKVAEIRIELDKRKAKAQGSGRTGTLRGTLADAVDKWDALEQHLTSYDSRRAELRAWVALYGPQRFASLTETHVREALGTWTKQGIAPKTIRNRLWSLKHLYHVLEGDDVSTPVDRVKPPAKVRTPIHHVSPQTILTVYRNLLKQEKAGILRDATTRARFMVRASTGRRPVEIMRAASDDVDFGKRTWRVRDAKGGWSEGLYLNDDMLVAWFTFAQANAWGPFDTGNMARVLRTAGWPAGVRPYSLRHSVGIDLSEGGADLADVGGWLGHTDVQTTRSAYVPILHSRMQKLSQSLHGRLGGWRATAAPRSRRGDTWKYVGNKDRGQKPDTARKHAGNARKHRA